MRNTKPWKWMSYLLVACLLAVSFTVTGNAQRRNPEAGKKKAAKRIGNLVRRHVKAVKVAHRPHLAGLGPHGQAMRG